MNKETKITIGVKVLPSYIKDIDTMVEFFQSRIELGKVTRSEFIVKALDAFTVRVNTSAEYQDFLAQRNAL